jgi:hypothetical protein
MELLRAVHVIAMRRCNPALPRISRSTKRAAHSQSAPPIKRSLLHDQLPPRRTAAADSEIAPARDNNIDSNKISKSRTPKSQAISQEPTMKTSTRKYQIAALILLFFTLGGRTTAQEPLPSAAPVNVEGKWTISAKNPDGSVDTKYVELKQNGNEITGHFKGPNQSGGLQGTVNNHHIFFRTKTREPLGFRGMVNGDTIEGTFHTRRGQGEFHAYRDPGTNSPN